MDEISLLQCQWYKISILQASVERETGFHETGADIYVMVEGTDALIECRMIFPIQPVVWKQLIEFLTRSGVW